MQAQMEETRTEVKAVQAEIRGMNEKPDDLITAHEINRSCVNGILEWTDKVRAIHDFPIPRI